MLAPVQEKRHQARSLAREARESSHVTDQENAWGREAARILRGHVGLTPEAQLDRLGKAAELYASCAQALEGKDEAASALYASAVARCVEAAALVAGRDNEAYQASKHQGSQGWTHHMLESHGAKMDDLKMLVPFLEYLEDDEDHVAEAAYQLHATLEAHSHAEEAVS